MLMTYDEALEFIYSRRKFQKSSGHERIARLLELNGNPHKRLRFVHVAGTNGKGSVSTALSFILRSAGYKTGLFTSPYVLEFGERIQIDGNMIPKCAVAAITSMLREQILTMEKEGLYPTVFEVITALAMIHFDDMNCDVVVLEAGIGGKRDSTNVIGTPDLAVITSVSLDHTDVLGKTVEEIAKEKCGIIKGGCPVVSYPFENGGHPFTPQNPDAARIIKEECAARGSTLYLPDADEISLISCDLYGTQFYYEGMHIDSTACGNFQIANLATAVKAAQVLGKTSFMISETDIESGIIPFSIPGRFECVSREPLIFLDAGHNEGAIRELKQSLTEYSNDKKTVALCAFMKDKDYSHCLESLAPLCDEIGFTLADAQRGESPELLSQKAKDLCEKTFFSADIDEAFLRAKEKSGKDGILLVCGSFYLVSEIRNKYFAS
ncbi:MAG: bifunctional folylpolyglutamate synthase/dihydrofolate synthase [Ruminococcaceae bacterium]|nr:bifunctional folylpolyglutamate synthase/dihydrofolate synthase [Oscillospiraceae bacterium]